MNNQNVKVTPQDIINSKNVKCERCDQNGNHSETFQNLFIIKKVSALLSPNGKELHVPIPVFACAECGHVNSEFMPDSLQSPLDS
jgi:uncharacterized Zn finger protein